MTEHIRPVRERLEAHKNAEEVWNCTTGLVIEIAAKCQELGLDDTEIIMAEIFVHLVELGNRFEFPKARHLVECGMVTKAKVLLDQNYDAS